MIKRIKLINYNEYERWRKTQKWIIRGNGIIATIIIFFAFLLFLAIIIVTIKHYRNYEEDKLEGRMQQTVLKTECTAGYCRWNNVKNCVMICESGDINLIECEIEIVYLEHSNCANHLNPRLILNQPILPDNTMSQNWLQLKSYVIIKTLDIYGENINNYEKNSFDSIGLRSIINLNLINAAGTVSREVFNGLITLEVLNIKNSTIQALPYILDPVNSTLKTLSVTEAKTCDMFPEDYTTGEKLFALTTVNFANNCFRNKITNKSFTTIIAVEILKLTNSKIRTIGEGAFDPIAGTVKEIDLRNNNLNTLPSEIFVKLFPNNNSLLIDLNNNPLKCDCALQKLKDTIASYDTNFSDNITCNGQILINVTLCELTTINTIETTSDRATTITSSSSSSTQQFTTSTTKRVTSTSTTESTLFTPTETSVNKKCYQITDVNRKRSIQLMQTLQYIKIIDIYDDVNILFELGGDLENYTLLWFTNSNNDNPLNEYFDVHKHLKCQTKLSKQILIKNFQHNSVYIFCLMNKYLTTILPSNCVSHKFKNSNYDENIWLWNSDKILTISLIIIGVIASFFITFFIGSRIGWYLYDKEINHQLSENRNTNCKNNVNDQSNVASVEQQHGGSLEFPINDLPPPYTIYECSGNTNNEIYEIAIKQSKCNDNTVDDSAEGVKVTSIECPMEQEKSTNFNLEIVPTTIAPIPLNNQSNEETSSPKEQIQFNKLTSETNTVQNVNLDVPPVAEILEEDTIYSTIFA